MSFKDIFYSPWLSVLVSNSYALVAENAEDQIYHALNFASRYPNEVICKKNKEQTTQLKKISNFQVVAQDYRIVFIGKAVNSLEEIG